MDEDGNYDQWPGQQFYRDDDDQEFERQGDGGTEETTSTQNSYGYYDTYDTDTTTGSYYDKNRHDHYSSTTSSGSTSKSSSPSIDLYGRHLSAKVGWFMYSCTESTTYTVNMMCCVSVKLHLKHKQKQMDRR